MARSLLNSNLGCFSIPRIALQLASGPPISPRSVTLLLMEASLLIIPASFLHANVAQTKGAMSSVFSPCTLSLSFRPPCTGACGQPRTEHILLLSHFG